MQKFILTIGPSLGGESSENSSAISLKEIHKDNFIYRINGAHGNAQTISRQIEKIRSQVPNAEILLDLPGNKIRTALEEPIALKNGQTFSLKRDNFNFGGFLDLAKSGDVVFANDSIFEFNIEKVNKDEIIFLSHSDGLLQNGKGMHIRGINASLPFLFEKDKELISLAHEYRLNFIGASFVRNAADFAELRGLLSKEIEIFCKIETKAALENLSEILKNTKYILIDRGDLAAEIGVLKIPKAQAHIIAQAHLRGVRVFLATQALKTMQENPLPTIAEISALYEIFKSGVYGVQLSEETAVGAWVKECIAMLEDMQNEVELEKILL